MKSRAPSKTFPLASLVAISLALGGCGESPAPDDAVEAIRPPEIARLKTAQEVLEGAHISTLDPATMFDAEIHRTLGAGPRCSFRYTQAGKPVLALTPRPDNAARGGVLKLNGSLIALDLIAQQTTPAAPNLAPPNTVALGAGPIRVEIRPVTGEPADITIGTGRQEAVMIFEIADSLRIGYRGYLDCTSGDGA